MSTKFYLILAGAGAVGLGILGFVHILGPTPQDSVFGQQWWLNDTQNFLHLIIGISSICAGLFLPKLRQQGAVWLLGVISIIGAVVSLIFRHLLTVNLVEPVEEVLYFSVGNIGLWVLAREVNDDLRKELKKFGNTISLTPPTKMDL